jgi:hypothetical protein
LGGSRHTAESLSFRIADVFDGKRVREALTIGTPSMPISVSDLIAMWLIQVETQGAGRETGEFASHANAKSPSHGRAKGHEHHRKGRKTAGGCGTALALEGPKRDAPSRTGTTL